MPDDAITNDGNESDGGGDGTVSGDCKSSVGE